LTALAIEAVEFAIARGPMVMEADRDDKPNERWAISKVTWLPSSSRISEKCISLWPSTCQPMRPRCCMGSGASGAPLLPVMRTCSSRKLIFAGMPPPAPPRDLLKYNIKPGFRGGRAGPWGRGKEFAAVAAAVARRQTTLPAKWSAARRTTAAPGILRYQLSLPWLTGSTSTPGATIRAPENPSVGGLPSAGNAARHGCRTGGRPDQDSSYADGMTGINRCESRGPPL